MIDFTIDELEIPARLNTPDQSAISSTATAAVTATVSDFIDMRLSIGNVSPICIFTISKMCSTMLSFFENDTLSALRSPDALFGSCILLASLYAADRLMPIALV